MSDYDYISNIIDNYRTPDGVYLSPRDCNNLSHFYGGYYLADKYNPTFARVKEIGKEPMDLISAVLHRTEEPLKEKWSRKLQDSKFDLLNGKYGIELYKQNPYMTDKEVLDFAYKKAIKNYLNQDRPLEVQKKIYGQILDNNSNKDIMYYYE